MDTGIPDWKKSMPNLTDEQIAHLKDLLQQREKQLRGDIDREVRERDDFRDVASELADPGDKSFADLTVDLGHAEVGRDLIELRAIEAAYARMHQGTYGDCVNCETAIPYERLEVQPMAERCAPCQGMYEKTNAGGLRGATI